MIVTSVGGRFHSHNLIAAQRPGPMVVVARGHTRPFTFGARASTSTNDPARPPVDEFVQDFTTTSCLMWRRTTVFSPTGRPRDGGLEHGRRADVEHPDSAPGTVRFISAFTVRRCSGSRPAIAGGATNTPAGPTFEERYKAQLDA